MAKKSKEMEINVKPGVTQEGPPIDMPMTNPEAAENQEKECLVNLTECLVKEKAEEIMKKLNVCRCHTCTQNVLALALNSLVSRYTTTNAGRLHVKLDFYKKQYETDVIAALTKACVRVKVSPRHERQG